MESVCRYYQNQFLVFFKDILKLEDWDDNMKSIDDAEQRLLFNSSQYNTQKSLDHLKEIELASKAQESQLNQMVLVLLQIRDNMAVCCPLSQS